VTATATALLARIDALDLDGLPAALSVPLRQARYSMEHRSHAADWYWTVIDPAGVGFYGLFLPSAYCGGHLLTMVVDTGMNVMGWGLEEAREFLRAHSAMSEAEIRSETLRYSCDIPAQALAYKLGEPELLRLRAAMQTARRARGHDLDVRDFHTAVLANGAMPLPDLWREVERQLA
jgi:hypothetical protein